MPSNRRRARQTQPETPEQNDSAITQEQTQGGVPIEGAVQEQGAGQGVQESEGPAQATAVEGAGEAPTPAVEDQETAGTEVEDQEAQSGLVMTVQLHTGAPVEDVVATADVTLGGVCTIRNVKIKEDDYGLKVVMPRTKMPDTGRFKDACFFHSPELREQFDAAVKEAYQQTLEPAQEQGGMGSMTL